MTVSTSHPPAEAATVDERLDLLAAQVSFLVDEARRGREQRERWAELSHDLAPLARQGMQSATRELGEIDVTLEDLARMFRTLLSSLPTLEASLRQLESLAELGRDVAPLSTLAVGSLTDRLQVFEERGYFDFARAGAGVVDRVVTSFTEEDVEALGDNIVLILNTVKEMTQPEVMLFLRRTINTVQGQEEQGPPPSMLGLLKEMRDPEVRRGLSRLLSMLRSMGEEPPAGTDD
ncbi:MAG: DUF1641 domain-containing protein [Acidimicrobiia bacterium]|jgi:uncharacterized protein YjgD (DUF1641 family)